MKNLLQLAQVLLLLFTAAVLFWLVRFPMLEGRAQHLDVIAIYTDPLILYLYAASLLFFFGVYQLYKVLGLARKNTFYSVETGKALQAISYCSWAMLLLIAGAAIYIRFNHHPEDDPAGFLGLSMLLILVTLAIGLTARSFSKKIGKRLA